jgi:hypothetical protein
MTTLVWLNFVRWEVAFGASHRLVGCITNDPVTNTSPDLKFA